MVISIKDGIKLVGISIVCFCAVFVCTFFLNYYCDASALGDTVGEQYKVLYDAQIATSKLVCVITGGVLCLIAVGMLAFYIMLFVDGNRKRFGLLKALGYSNGRIAVSFWVFGLSVGIGALLGFCAGWAIMPLIYKELTLDGMPEVVPQFRFWLFVVLVIMPSAVFSLLSCGYAALTLRQNVGDMLKNNGRAKAVKRVSDRERSFPVEMALSVLRSKKSTVFFIAFSCFCFSAMVQMGASMRTLSSVTMGVMILSIGIVLAITAMIMAVTTVINANARNISLMKAFGYSTFERIAILLVGYVPFALLGFGVGTVYQYGLLRLMMDLVYVNVPNMPEYSFDVAAFFITLGAFIAAYVAVMGFYSFKISRVSVKKTMRVDD
ncbi:MAG: ABC transporter permease [Clostridiales bacterium]|nr:ABC transporter permease [Clostridiales bacterium]